MLLVAVSASAGARTKQMTSQYHWLYERTGLLTWRSKA